MKRRRRRQRGATARQRAWLNSARWAEASKVGAKRSLALRRHMPRCGARKKGGGVCRNLPVPDRKRCRLHSGLPNQLGDSWHVVQYPDPITQPERYAKKVAEIRRRRQQQRERVAKMTSEELSRYRAWHAARKPGSAAARARKRQDREAAKLFEKPSPQLVNPEIARLEAVLDELRRRCAQLEAETADEGVFG